MARVRPPVSAWTLGWLDVDPRRDASLQRRLVRLLQSPALTRMTEPHDMQSARGLADLFAQRERPLAINARLLPGDLMESEPDTASVPSPAYVAEEEYQIQELITDPAVGALEMSAEEFAEYRRSRALPTPDGFEANVTTFETDDSRPSGPESGVETSSPRQGDPTRTVRGPSARPAVRPSRQSVETPAAPARADIRRATATVASATPESASDTYSRLLAERLRRARSPVPVQTGPADTPSVPPPGEQVHTANIVPAPPAVATPAIPSTGGAQERETQGTSSRMQSPAPADLSPRTTEAQPAPAAASWNPARSKAMEIEERINRAQLARETGATAPTYGAPLPSAKEILDQRLTQGLRTQLAEREGVEPAALGETPAPPQLTREEAMRRAERWRRFSRVEVLSSNTPAPTEEGVLPKMPPPPRPPPRPSALPAAKEPVGDPEPSTHRPDAEAIVTSDAAQRDDVHEVWALERDADPSAQVEQTIVQENQPQAPVDMPDPAQAEFEDFESMLDLLEADEDASAAESAAVNSRLTAEVQETPGDQRAPDEQGTATERGSEAPSHGSVASSDDVFQAGTPPTSPPAAARVQRPDGAADGEPESPSVTTTAHASPPQPAESGATETAATVGSSDSVATPATESVAPAERRTGRSRAAEKTQPQAETPVAPTPVASTPVAPTPPAADGLTTAAGSAAPAGLHDSVEASRAAAAPLSQSATGQDAPRADVIERAVETDMQTPEVLDVAAPGVADSSHEPSPADARMDEPTETTAASQGSTGEISSIQTRNAAASNEARTDATREPVQRSNASLSEHEMQPSAPSVEQASLPSGTEDSAETAVESERPAQRSTAEPRLAAEGRDDLPSPPDLRTEEQTNVPTRSEAADAERLSASPEAGQSTHATEDFFSVSNDVEGDSLRDAPIRFSEAPSSVVEPVEARPSTSPGRAPDTGDDVAAVAPVRAVVEEGREPSEQLPPFGDTAENASGVIEPSEARETTAKHASGVESAATSVPPNVGAAQRPSAAVAPASVPTAAVPAAAVPAATTLATTSVPALVQRTPEDVMSASDDEMLQDAPSAPVSPTEQTGPVDARAMPLARQRRATPRQQDDAGTNRQATGGTAETGSTPGAALPPAHGASAQGHVDTEVSPSSRVDSEGMTLVRRREEAPAPRTGATASAPEPDVDGATLAPEIDAYEQMQRAAAEIHQHVLEQAAARDPQGTTGSRQESAPLTVESARGTARQTQDDLYGTRLQSQHVAPPETFNPEPIPRLSPETVQSPRISQSPVRTETARVESTPVRATPTQSSTRPASAPAPGMPVAKVQRAPAPAVPASAPMAPASPPQPFSQSFSSPVVSDARSSGVPVAHVEVIQRDFDDIDTTDGDDAGGMSLDEIARQVYPLLKDLLRFERDRFD